MLARVLYANEIMRSIAQEANMSKKLKLAFLAAVLAMIGALSSPVLAAGYDDPAFTGGGSNGYNSHIGDS